MDSWSPFRGEGELAYATSQTHVSVTSTHMNYTQIFAPIEPLTSPNVEHCCYCRRKLTDGECIKGCGGEQG